MSTEQALAFVAFAVVAAITPGPSNMLLTAAGASAGVRRGLPCLFGVALGMGLMMFVVAFGLGSLVLESPLILQGIKLAGIGFLLWLAWTIATADPVAPAAATNVIGFWAAAAFQWVNPKSWLVSASAAGAYLHPEAASAVVQSISFGVLFALAALPSCFVWLAFGATVQQFLQTTRARRSFNIVMALLLVGSIVWIVW